MTASQQWLRHKRLTKVMKNSLDKLTNDRQEVRLQVNLTAQYLPTYLLRKPVSSLTLVDMKEQRVYPGSDRAAKAKTSSILLDASSQLLCPHGWFCFRQLWQS